MPDVFLKGTAHAKNSVRHGRQVEWDPQLETAKLLAPIVEPIKSALIALHNSQTTIKQQKELIDQLQRELSLLRSGDGA